MIVLPNRDYFQQNLKQNVWVHSKNTEKYSKNFKFVKIKK
jgi:hypothetical protein